MRLSGTQENGLPGLQANVVEKEGAEYPDVARKLVVEAQHERYAFNLLARVHLARFVAADEGVQVARVGIRGSGHNGGEYVAQGSFLSWAGGISVCGRGLSQREEALEDRLGNEGCELWGGFEGGRQGMEGAEPTQRIEGRQGYCHLRFVIRV